MPPIKSTPRISVCIASYNHACYLDETLTCIGKQTLQDYEVVVVDDGSKDNSLEILTSWSRRDPRIRVFTHPGGANLGISKTINLALRHCGGCYVAWTGSDDTWYPDCLETLSSILERDQTVSLAYGRMTAIDGSGATIDRHRGFGYALTGAQNNLYRLIEWNPIPASVTMLRRSVLREIGNFDESLVYSDWEMWIRLLARWDVKFVPKTLGCYRIHGQNISVGCPAATQLARQLNVLTTLRGKAVTLQGSFANPTFLAALELQISCLLYLLGDERESSQSIKAALTIDESLCSDHRRIAGWLDRTSDLWGQYDSPQVNGIRFGEWFLGQLELAGGDNIRHLRVKLTAIVGQLRTKSLVQSGHYAEARWKTFRGLLRHPAHALCRRHRSFTMRTILGRHERP